MLLRPREGGFKMGAWDMKLKKAIPFLLSAALLGGMSQEEASQQAKKLGEEGNAKLLNLFSQGIIKTEDHSYLAPSLFDVNDLLSENDKGKLLTAEDAEEKIQKETLPTFFEKELTHFLEEAKKKDEEREAKGEKLEGTEPFLTKSREIIEEPLSQEGVSISKWGGPQEQDHLVTCQEGGAFQAFVSLHLNVKKGQKKKEVKTWVCKGHGEAKQFEGSGSTGNAKKFFTDKLNELQQNPNIDKDSIALISHKYGWRSQNTEVKYCYSHIEGYQCDKAKPHSKTITERYEEDIWEPDDKEFYKSLSTNSNCKLLSEKIIEPGETKSIEGQSVYREVWAKKLCYQCSFLESESCKNLRENGVLVGKRCLKENSQSQCELWEKTYDIAALKQGGLDIVDFSNLGIWGAQDEFDKTYPPNKDFGEVITTLSVFSDMKEELSEKPVDINLDLRVFGGKAFKCKKNKFDHFFYDCCGTLDGGLIKMNIVDCDSEEKLLQKARQEGRAIWVDKKKSLSLEGFSESNCYCVFPTKLARIVQEFARKKFPEYDPLHPFGDLKNPDCSGITLDQLTDLDFEEIDLSEVIGDLKEKITQKGLGKKLNDISKEITSEDLYQNVESNMKPYRGDIQ